MNLELSEKRLENQLVSARKVQRFMLIMCPQKKKYLSFGLCFSCLFSPLY